MLYRCFSVLQKCWKVFVTAESKSVTIISLFQYTCNCRHDSTWKWHSGFLKFLKCWDWTLACARWSIVHGLFMYVCIYVASFPGLPRFCSSVCVQYSTQKWKGFEKRGRPGNTYHMTWMWDGCEGEKRWGEEIYEVGKEEGCEERERGKEESIKTIEATFWMVPRVHNRYELLMVHNITPLVTLPYSSVQIQLLLASLRWSHS